MQKIVISIFFVFTSILISAQEEQLQTTLDSLRIAGNFPGLSAAITYKDKTIAITSGLNDKEKNNTKKKMEAKTNTTI